MSISSVGSDMGRGLRGSSGTSIASAGASSGSWLSKGAGDSTLSDRESEL